MLSVDCSGYCKEKKLLKPHTRTSRIVFFWNFVCKERVCSVFRNVQFKNQRNEGFFSELFVCFSSAFSQQRYLTQLKLGRKQSEEEVEILWFFPTLSALSGFFSHPENGMVEKHRKLVLRTENIRHTNGLGGFHLNFIISLFFFCFLWLGRQSS